MPSVHRFWDLIEYSDVYFFSDESQNLPGRLLKTKILMESIHGQSSSMTIEGETFILPPFLRYYAAVCRRSHFNEGSRYAWLWLSVLGLPLFIVLSWLFPPKIDTKAYDIIWVGGNNFDRSNIILLWFKYSNKLDPSSAVIRSYKESSGQFSLDEYLMLRQRAFYIFPSEEYLPFYRSIYGSNIFGNSKGFRFVDEDLRFSKLKNYLLRQTTEKIQDSVVILTGRLLLESKTPSDNRYIYYDYCEDLVKSGHTVYIHTPRVSNEVRKTYEGIEGVNVLGPLDLETKLGDYMQLTRYEFGVMHNPKVKEKLSDFTKINIPNRFYEYDMCKIEPLKFHKTESKSFREFSQTLLELADI